MNMTSVESQQGGTNRCNLGKNKTVPRAQPAQIGTSPGKKKINVFLNLKHDD